MSRILPLAILKDYISDETARLLEDSKVITYAYDLEGSTAPSPQQQTYDAKEVSQIHIQIPMRIHLIIIMHCQRVSSANYPVAAHCSMDG